MNRETFDEAKHLLDKINKYKNIINSINTMINDCCKTAYSEDAVNITVYNGSGHSHDAYINRTLIKNMLIGAKDHYEAIIDQCEYKLEKL